MGINVGNVNSLYDQYYNEARQKGGDDFSSRQLAEGRIHDEGMGQGQQILRNSEGAFEFQGMPSPDSFVDKLAGTIPYLGGAAILGGGLGFLGGPGASMPAAVPEVDPTFGGALQQVGPGTYAAAGAGLGLGASEALGVGAGVPGVTQGAAVPGAETAGLGATTGAAPSATAAGAATPASSAAGAAGAGKAAEMGFTESLLAQMKNNALALGLMGAGTAASLSAGKSQVPNQQQMQGLSAEAQATANQLLQQYRSGNLSASQQAGLDQLTNQTKNQLKQYFASIGQSDSTAAAQAMAQVDQQALAMKQQMLDNALQQGLQAIGVAQGPLNSVAQYQLGQDQALRQAFGNFASGVGLLFGRNAGSTQQQTGRPTAPAPVVQSTQNPIPVG